MYHRSAVPVFCKSKIMFLKNAFSATILLPDVFSPIMIHRKSLETLFLVTGLAQWAGPRTGPGVGSGGYRVRFQAQPRLFVSFFHLGTCVDMFGELVWTLVGHVFDIFWTLFGHASTFSGHVWEGFGDLLGQFRISWG